MNFLLPSSKNPSQLRGVISSEIESLRHPQIQVSGYFIALHKNRYFKYNIEFSRSYFTIALYMSCLF